MSKSKVITAIIVAVSIVCLIFAAGLIISTSVYAHSYEYFITIGRYGDYDIVYDKDTKVLYSISHSHGVVTELVNPDGFPKLYSEE